MSPRSVSEIAENAKTLKTWACGREAWWEYKCITLYVLYFRATLEGNFREIFIDGLSQIFWHISYRAIDFLKLMI